MKTQKIREWLCKKFGHRVSDIDRTLFFMEVSAIAFNGKLEIKCERCGKDIVREVIEGYEKKYGKLKLPKGVRY